MSISLTSDRIAPAGPPTELLDGLHDATLAVLAAVAPDLEAEGLAPCTFWTLYRLASGGADHPGAIARRLGVTMPSVTQNVDQLVGSGLVSRHRSESDRRIVRLEITPAGRRVLARVVRRVDRTLAQGLKGQPAAEVRAAARLLRTVAARLRRSELPAAEGDA